MSVHSIWNHLIKKETLLPFDRKTHQLLLLLLPSPIAGSNRRLLLHRWPADLATRRVSDADSSSARESFAAWPPTSSPLPRQRERDASGEGDERERPSLDRPTYPLPLPPPPGPPRSCRHLHSNSDSIFTRSPIPLTHSKPRPVYTAAKVLNSSVQFWCLQFGMINSIRVYEDLPCFFLFLTVDLQRLPPLKLWFLIFALDSYLLVTGRLEAKSARCYHHRHRRDLWVPGLWFKVLKLIQFTDFDSNITDFDSRYNKLIQFTMIWFKLPILLPILIQVTDSRWCCSFMGCAYWSCASFASLVRLSLAFYTGFAPEAAAARTGCSSLSLWGLVLDGCG